MLKKIPGFTNYSVNEYGEIFSTRGNLLCQWTDNMGYKQVVLYKNNKRYYKRVHRLVYEAFNGPIKDGLLINHIDEDKSNNEISNLELTTNSVNIKHFHYYNNVKSYDISVYDKATNNLVGRYTSLRAMCNELDINRKTVTSILKGIKKTNNYKYKFINNKTNQVFN